MKGRSKYRLAMKRLQVTDKDLQGAPAAPAAGRDSPALGHNKDASQDTHHSLIGSQVQTPSGSEDRLPVPNVQESPEDPARCSEGGEPPGHSGASGLPALGGTISRPKPLSCLRNSVLTRTCVCERDLVDRLHSGRALGTIREDEEDLLADHSPPPRAPEHNPTQHPATNRTFSNLAFFLHKVQCLLNLQKIAIITKRT